MFGGKMKLVLSLIDTSRPWWTAVPLIVLALGLAAGRLILLGVRLRRRSEFLDVLRTEVPEFYEALSAPSFTLWQQLWRRRDPFAGDRLWFYALWRADSFPDEPRVQAALAAYRRVEFIRFGYTALVLTVACVVLVFMHR